MLVLEKVDPSKKILSSKKSNDDTFSLEEERPIFVTCTSHSWQKGLATPSENACVKRSPAPFFCRNSQMLPCLLNDATCLHFRPSEESEERNFWFGDPARLPNVAPPLYPHNTYHGQTPHHRPPLSLDFKPMRFTEESQQHLGATPKKASTPMGRRRTSEESSNEGLEVK